MADRAYLSIGEVLALLKDEFPEITISKIRFLESQGLLNPERTPSGYRKFYEPDVERLRWILQQQRENFLPLKVIKGRLGVEPGNGTDRPGAGTPAPSPSGADVIPPSPAAAEPRPQPRPEGRPLEGRVAPRPAQPPPGRRPIPPPPPRPVERRPQPSPPAAASEVPAEPSTVPTAPERAPRPEPRPAPAPVPDPVATASVAPPPDASVNLTRDELLAAAELTLDQLTELEKFGLVTSRHAGGAPYYDGDGLAVARVAAAFMRFGVEARHLRMYKNAAEREAGVFEQIVMPLMKQRNPDARRQAIDTLGELASLGEQLRAALLHDALREHTAD